MSAVAVSPRRARGAASGLAPRVHPVNLPCDSSGAPKPTASTDPAFTAPGKPGAARRLPSQDRASARNLTRARSVRWNDARDCPARRSRRVRHEHAGLTWGETTIVVDAGVMFPDPELLGRRSDHSGSHLPAAEGARRRAGADARPRGSHRRRAVRRAATSTGPIYGTPLTLALVEPSSSEHGHRCRAIASTRAAARARRGRAVRDRVHPRDAQHARLRGPGDSHAGRHHRPHRRFQDRSDADRRRALRRSPLRGARRLRACSRSSPTARTSIAAASPDPRSRSSKRSRRFHERAGRLMVAAFASSIYRMQMLVRPGGAVRSQGRVRRPRDDRELADRATARLSARSRRAS